MTVLQRITKDISTAYTDVPMILGTRLVELTKIVKAELDTTPTISSQRSIEWDMSEDWYSPMWYHNVWEKVVRPITLRYIEEHTPNAWYKTHYEYAHYD